MTLIGEREPFFLTRQGDVVVIDGTACFPASCLGSMPAALASVLGMSGWSCPELLPVSQVFAPQAHQCGRKVEPQ
jgi:hypothetical protein